MRKVEIKKGGKTLIPNGLIADSFLTRFMGLMGKGEVKKDHALIFPKCNSIHTFFMRIPIDVVFVTKNGEVVEILEALQTWRLLFPRSGVKHTIELAAKRARELGIGKGDKLVCEGVWS